MPLPAGMAERRPADTGPPAENPRKGCGVCFGAASTSLSSLWSWFLLVRKPLKQGLAGRRENIQKELDELEQKKADAKRELQNFETRLGALKEEREAIVKEFKKEGEREKAKIIESAQKTASRIVEQAQMTIQQEMQKSNQALREEVAGYVRQNGRRHPP